MAQLVARPTPDRKVGSSILSGLSFFSSFQILIIYGDALEIKLKQLFEYISILVYYFTKTISLLTKTDLILHAQHHNCLIEFVLAALSPYIAFDNEVLIETPFEFALLVDEICFGV